MQILKKIKTSSEAQRQNNSQRKNQEDANNTTPAPVKKVVLNPNG